MDLKPLAYLFVRLNGIIIILYAAIELTDFPFYFRMIAAAGGEEPYHAEAMQNLGISALRFLIQLIVGLTFMAKTNKVINFLMADLNSKKPND